MAVYTVLDREDIEQFILPFGIGPLVDFEGVADGIENTNYFISTDQTELPNEFKTTPIQHFVLTIFEQIDTDHLAFYIKLTTLFNRHGLPVPCPLQDANGIAIQSIQGKPAVIIPKLNGKHPKNPSVELCSHIGEVLANIHLVSLESSLEHQSNRNLAWIGQCADTLRSEVDDTDMRLLNELPRFFEQVDKHPDLPLAIIHGDLFCDNALAQDNRITGIIDFNSAGSGYLMMDLAIIANDWCTNEDGSFKQDNLSALLSSYQQARQFTDDEKALWNDFLRIAAMRFWVSRLFNQLHPNKNRLTDGLVEQKDPLEFKTILLARINKPYILK